LIRHAWSKTEVTLYNEIRTNLIDLKVVCDRSFVNGILLRYAKIRMKHQISNSLILKFLGHLIKESIEKKVDFMLFNFDKEINGYSGIRVINSINKELKRDFDMIQAGINREERFYPKINEYVASRGTTGGEYEYFISILNIFYMKVISFSFEKEIHRMIKSYIELLQFHLGNYDRYIDGLKQIVLDIQAELEPNDQLNPIEKEKLILVIKTAEFFIDILLDYARQNNMQIVTFNPL
jgi:hypothetical protein